MTERMNYTKEDFRLAKAKLYVLESEINKLVNISEEKLTQLEELRKNADHIRKMRIRDSKRRYDRSSAGKAKNRARSLKNYYKNKAKKSED
jgi:hypothetical protein